MRRPARLWFNLAVVALWLTSMGWLVKEKVLPPLLLGDPPDYRTVVKARREEERVGWAMTWNDRPLGWAITLTKPLPHDLTEFRTRVHFDRLPIDDQIAKWSRSWLGTGDELKQEIHLDADNLAVFDPMYGLSRFESSVCFPPSPPLLKVQGTIDGAKMHVVLRYGELAQDRDFPAPNRQMLEDALSPQTRLPGLRQGQKWTVELYSPWSTVERPTEILEATVEGRELLMIDARLVDAWLVVYRNDAGSRAAGDEQPRARLWVDADGTVWKQQVRLFDSMLTFTRLPDRRAAELERDVHKDWHFTYESSP